MTFRAVYTTILNLSALNPDCKIICTYLYDWHARYGGAIACGFTSENEFITMVNMVLNYRKSRAGKRLDHHLSTSLWQQWNHMHCTGCHRGEQEAELHLPFVGIISWHDSFPTDKMIFLAANPHGLLTLSYQQSRAVCVINLNISVRSGSEFLWLRWTTCRGRMLFPLFCSNTLRLIRWSPRQNMSAIQLKNTKPKMYLRKHSFAQGYRYRIVGKSIPNTALQFQLTAASGTVT